MRTSSPSAAIATPSDAVCSEGRPKSRSTNATGTSKAPRFLKTIVRHPPEFTCITSYLERQRNSTCGATLRAGVPSVEIPYHLLEADGGRPTGAGTHERVVAHDFGNVCRTQAGGID